MLTKEAQEKAYMIGVDMALEEAGLIKTAAPGVGLMEKLLTGGGKHLSNAKNFSMLNPAMAGAVGGAGVGGLGGAVFGDEGGFLRGVGGGALAGAGLGAGANLAAKLHGAGQFSKSLQGLGGKSNFKLQADKADAVRRRAKELIPSDITKAWD